MLTSNCFVVANATNNHMTLAEFRMSPEQRKNLDYLYIHAGCNDDDERARLLCRRIGQPWFPEIDFRDLERRYAYSHL